MRVVGASRSEIRISLLAQAATLGVAGALVAFAMLGAGTWLLMREPSRRRCSPACRWWAPASCGRCCPTSS